MKTITLCHFALLLPITLIAGCGGPNDDDGSIGQAQAVERVENIPDTPEQALRKRVSEQIGYCCNNDYDGWFSMTNSASNNQPKSSLKILFKMINEQFHEHNLALEKVRIKIIMEKKAKSARVTLSYQVNHRSSLVRSYDERLDS